MCEAMTETVVALVPMRHHSERVPGKNYRKFGGVPLYHHIVQRLLACPQISQIVIDTDSPIIVSDATEYFPQVTLLERPPHLRADDVSMNDVLLHDISQVGEGYYLQTHSTNPLLQAETIQAAITRFFGAHDADSLFGVTRWQTRLYDAHGTPLNHDPRVLLRTQDLPPVFEENSNLYLFSSDTLRRVGRRIGDQPILFEIDREEALDIDTEADFTMAEIMYTKGKRE